MNMEDSVRSGGVLKKKNSSGCLIIKKKVENGNSGGGCEGLSNHSKERKRSRFVADRFGVSEEDESLEFMRRKVNDRSLHNGSMGYRRNEFENREYERSNVGIDLNGERRRWRSNEYDGFDERRMREEYLEDMYKMDGCRGGENSKDFVMGSSRRNPVPDRRHSFYYDGSSSGRSKGGESTVLRNKGFELEEDGEDEEEIPVPLLRLKYPEVTDEPIRLQGKNGVLKVMVNKKTKMELHSHYNRFSSREVEERARCRSEDVLKNDLFSRIPNYPISKPPENRGLWMEKEKNVEKEKMDVKLEKEKPRLSKGIKMREMETDVTDTALKLAPPGVQASSSKKVVKKEEERAPQENITPVKGKEAKVKRGGCTEKQMLREKIREMLIDSGWSIDYRPRRNRDYLDAVYINPSGTAYWSIIKAYEALKKQLEEDNSKSKVVIDSPSFAPLSEDLINKLTRQTKKKIEEEMKRKRKEDGLTKSGKISSVRDAGENSDSDQNEQRLSSCRKQNHKSQRSKFIDMEQGSDGDLSNHPPRKKFRKIEVEKNTSAPNLSVLQGRTSKVIGRCTLRVRSSNEGENSESDGYIPYSGKRTVLAWLIDSGTAQSSEKVQYMNRRRNRVMLEGWITRDGIHCGCCSKILTVSKFELHAGSKLRQPFQNIFLESGPSLLQCQVDAWNKQGESVCRDFHTVGVQGDDPDDDACGICGDGGALICCDSCPSTFHQICLEIKILPSGDWHCQNCVCKFCGDASGNATEENNDADEFTRCSFCEEKYHKSCSEEVLGSSMSSIGGSFCGLKCQELYDHLQKMLGVKHELEGGLSWSLIQRTDVSDSSHRAFPQRVESNSKLAVALSVMEECFFPVIDRRSGINMIRNVVYNIGSNFHRLNYCGFYTIVLERGDEVVSAASLRIRQTHLAEMPFIGTRDIYRRQGMCRHLLSAIETELHFLKVEQLIIPAISQHMNTWTSVFGFHQLEDVLKKEIKSMNVLVFPGTDMLQKPLSKHSDGKLISIPSIGMKLSESAKNQSQLSAMVEKSDINSPMSNDSGLDHDTKAKDKVIEPDSGFPAPASPNNNMAASASDSASEPNTPIVVKSEVNQNKFSAILDSTCTTEAPCLKSIRDSGLETLVVTVASGKQNNFSFNNAETTSFSGVIGSSVKVSEDTDPQETVNTSALKASPLTATIEEDAAIEDRSTVSAVKSEINSPTADSAATSETKGCAVDSSILNDGKALCVKRSLEALPEVSAPTSILPLIDSGEVAETECKNDGEIASVSSSESLDRTVGPTERI